VNTERGSEDVAVLRARLDELEAEVRNLRGGGRRVRRRRGAVDATDAPEPVSRRHMLGLLKGAAAAGAGMAVLGSSKTAFATVATPGAANGDALSMGNANTGVTAETSLTGSVATDSVFKVNNTNHTGSPWAIEGVQSSSDPDLEGGFGVYGTAHATAAVGVAGVHRNSGVGLAGVSASGAALVVTDSFDALFEPSVPMPPTTGTWSTGSMVNSSGQLWYCYVAGVGSASKWVRLSSSFVPVTPTRVYDSRAGAPSPTGILPAGANRLVSVADGRNGAGAVVTPNLVPAGATAVTANVTVTGTTSGFGYLAINPGGNTVEGASTINWFGAGQTIANGVTLTLNVSREVTVICNGAAGASTHFLIDVSGYYL